MREKTKIDFIKDNLNKLSEIDIDEIVKKLKKISIPKKAFSVDINIDPDDDFEIIGEDGKRNSWGFDTVKYFDTEDECFEWLTHFAKTAIVWRYKEKESLVEWVQEEILNMVKERKHSLSIQGNQIIEIEIWRTKGA